MIGGGIIVINTDYILPAIVLIICFIALIRRVQGYHAFVDGAKDGMRLFLDIYPALLAMMFSITLLRKSGLMEMLCNTIASGIQGIPKEIWPMVFFRPLSGNASLAVLSDIFQTCGVDSLPGIMASVIQGSTDTTFYVITLYFSSVGVRKIKNALSIGLLADVAGISMAIFLTMLFFAS